MSGIEAAFIFGGIFGFIFGLWLGGRMLLSRMHHDDVEGAHATYKKRKGKYLGGKK
jgi:hypothetical protein